MKHESATHSQAGTSSEVKESSSDRKSSELELNLAEKLYSYGLDPH